MQQQINLEVCAGIISNDKKVFQCLPATSYKAAVSRRCLRASSSPQQCLAGTGKNAQIPTAVIRLQQRSKLPRPHFHSRSSVCRLRSNTIGPRVLREQLASRCIPSSSCPSLPFITSLITRISNGVPQRLVRLLFQRYLALKRGECDPLKISKTDLWKSVRVVHC